MARYSEKLRVETELQKVTENVKESGTRNGAELSRRVQRTRSNQNEPKAEIEKVRRVIQEKMTRLEKLSGDVSAYRLRTHQARSAATNDTDRTSLREVERLEEKVHRTIDQRWTPTWSPEACYKPESDDVARQIAMIVGAESSPGRGWTATALCTALQSLQQKLDESEAEKESLRSALEEKVERADAANLSTNQTLEILELKRKSQVLQKTLDSIQYWSGRWREREDQRRRDYEAAVGVPWSSNPTLSDEAEPRNTTFTAIVDRIDAALLPIEGLEELEGPKDWLVRCSSESTSVFIIRKAESGERIVVRSEDKVEVLKGRIRIEAQGGRVVAIPGASLAPIAWDSSMPRVFDRYLWKYYQEDIYEAQAQVLGAV